MASKYRPQVQGWIGDLYKGPSSSRGADNRLLYANDNYCAFIRKTKIEQIGHTLGYLLLSICLISAIVFISLLVFVFNTSHDVKIEIFNISALIACFLGAYVILPELYQSLFTRRGAPIIFNRKTGKVYVNESYFYNYKFLKNPLTYLHPSKKRIKEYDWAHLQGVVVHNLSRDKLVSIVLMVCKPQTHKTIDHILLDSLRAGRGSYLVWGWVNNFMCFNDLFDLNEGKYKTDEELQFKKEIIEGQGWPEWMVEAFNATTHDELAKIKKNILYNERKNRDKNV